MAWTIRQQSTPTDYLAWLDQVQRELPWGVAPSMFAEGDTRFDWYASWEARSTPTEAIQDAMAEYDHLIEYDETGFSF